MPFRNLILFFAVIYSANSYAAIFKCKDNKGQVAYSNAACNTQGYEDLNPKPHTSSPAASAKALLPNTSSRTANTLEQKTNELSLPQPAVSTANTAQFQCDGRTHCSQMTSCDEATFFINHCPNTKMDGNNDGIPCERQWC